MNGYGFHCRYFRNYRQRIDNQQPVGCAFMRTNPLSTKSHTVISSPDNGAHECPPCSVTTCYVYLPRSRGSARSQAKSSTGRFPGSLLTPHYPIPHPSHIPRPDPEPQDHPHALPPLHRRRKPTCPPRPRRRCACQQTVGSAAMRIPLMCPRRLICNSDKSPTLFRYPKTLKIPPTPPPPAPANSAPAG